MLQAPSATPTAQARSVNSLRADVSATQATLDDVVAQRAGIAARANATRHPAERSQLLTELRVLDDQIARLSTQLEGMKAELRVLESRRVPIKVSGQIQTPTRAPGPGGGFAMTAPPDRGLQENEMILGGVVTVFVLAPLAFALAWRLIRRPAPAVNRVELAEQNERLRRIEQAVDTIAIEVERVSENQRYLTNTIASESKAR
jgi:hypothetical protein